MIKELSFKHFGELIKLDDCVFEWNKQFKNDVDVGNQK